MISFLPAVLLLAVGIILTHAKSMELRFPNQTYLHLPRHQGVLMINLTNQITIDRKAYKSIWIYRNGFVTLGYALEEDSYPIRTVDGRAVHQPIEDMVGDNVIAVFLTWNKATASSVVRVREALVASLDTENKEVFIQLESLVKRAFGPTIVRSMKSVVVVDWVDMEIEGWKGMKNSFRMYILSGDTQSFAIFQFWNITSTSYRFFTEWKPYQSGVRSYGNRHILLPFYEVSNMDLSLEKSSNIGIKNTWLLALGDLSSSIDLGLPKEGWLHKTKGTKTKYVKKNSSYSLIHRSTKAFLPEQMASRTVESADSGKGKGRHRKNLDSTIQMQESRSTNGREITRLLAYTNDCLPTAVDSQSPTSRETTRGGKLRKNAGSTKKYTQPQEALKEDKLGNDLEPSSPNELLKGSYIDYQSKYSSTPTGYGSNNFRMSSMVQFLSPRTMQSPKDVPNRNHKPTPIRQYPTTVDLTLFTTSTPVPTKEATNPSSKSKVDELIDTTKVSYEDYIQSKNLPIRNGDKNLSPKRQSSCQQDSCTPNEECFLYKDSPCCRCAPGSAHHGHRCYAAGDPSRVRSSGTITLAVDGRTLSFDLNLATMVPRDNQSFYISLQSNTKIEPSFRTFLLLLFPLYHIPMTFHAWSWKAENVPNLSSFVDSKAAINIYIFIEGYGELYVTFKLDRSLEDQWTIYVKESIDSKLVNGLHLEGLKLDEKPSNSLPFKYSLSHRNSVEFTEKILHFVDETRNRTIKVKWRGTMTFSPTCLANHIESRNFYVTFSDSGYCTSNCAGDQGDQCRLVCLSTSYVFDRIPGPCAGNQCPNNLMCVADKERYDCSCPNGQHKVGDRCVVDSSESDEQRILRQCAKCSSASSCKILNGQVCCMCPTGFMGSGKTCFRRDGQFEIKGFGKLSVDSSDKSMDFKLLFRQWHSGNSIKYATYVNIDRLSYSNNVDRDLAHLMLLLFPIFDIPMSLFAKYEASNVMTSIYDMSKGSLVLKINIDGISSSRLMITLKVTETDSALEMSMLLTASAATINQAVLHQSMEFFEKRLFPSIKYQVKGRRLTLLPYSVLIWHNFSSILMNISGSGRLDDCASNSDFGGTFEVSTLELMQCKAKCLGGFCTPFCQAVPLLKLVPEVSECDPSCHAKAKCIDTVCVCRPGYSGDGLFCYQIRKTLECESDLDCNRTPHFQCKNSTCICKTGMVLKDNLCVDQDPCRSCKTNEVCQDNQCVCRHQFERNRRTQLCTFDCSLCDVYSTLCTSDGCECKPRFVYETDSSVSCTLTCQTDTDCPTNEVCGTMMKCLCPTRKSDGMCQSNLECSSCHKSAVCKDNRCHCLPDMVGDGISCSYNCSMCFHPSYCNPHIGCSCPPGMLGDGKLCVDDVCAKCPPYSRCETKQDGVLHCKCVHGWTMDRNQCTKDTVHIQILPPDSILAPLGSQVEVFCIGASKFNNFRLTWSRRSGKAVSGLQNFVSEINSTLRLIIPSMAEGDVDEYLCNASTNESSSIAIELEERKCSGLCHRLASCVYGKCQCGPQYIGDGLECALPTNCSSACPGDMICDEGRGQCQCKPGFRQDHTNVCVSDCTLQPVCDPNAICEPETGLCRCIQGFLGNGIICSRKRISCLLTKKCGMNASCIRVDSVNQHICVCNDAYIGDGETCEPRVNCDYKPCGRYSFCEPTIVKDHLGNLHQNGRCSCEPGYKWMKNKCEDPGMKERTLWMSMGEAIISLGSNDNRSRIRFIDSGNESGVDGGIVTLAGDCSNRRLYWSGQNGAVLRSLAIGEIITSSTLLAGAGKIAGISVDVITGNVFFTDTYRGTISVLDPRRNISKIIIHEVGYRPSQIVAHSESGSIYWLVGDLGNPRIETSFMTGERRREFLVLVNRPISLTIIPSNGHGNDQLCWVEVNGKAQADNQTTNGWSHGFIKCTDINGENPRQMVRVIHNIDSEEPSSAFTYYDKFYWGVSKGKYLRTFDTALSMIPVVPNCCDVSVRGLFVMPDVCPRESMNPCLNAMQSGCRHICVVKSSSTGTLDPVCLNNKN